MPTSRKKAVRLRVHADGPMWAAQTCLRVPGESLHESLQHNHGRLKNVFASFQLLDVDSALTSQCKGPHGQGQSDGKDEDNMPQLGVWCLGPDRRRKQSRLDAIFKHGRGRRHAGHLSEDRAGTYRRARCQVHRRGIWGRRKEALVLSGKLLSCRSTSDPRQVSFSLDIAVIIQSPVWSCQVSHEHTKASLISKQTQTNNKLPHSF